MIDELADAIEDSQLARLAVHDRQHDDAEVHLKLRVLIKIVQDNLGSFAALQLDDDAHAIAVALVAYLADAFDSFVVGERRDIRNEARLVDLVRQLGDNQRFAIARQVLGGNLGAALQRAASPVK